jgi:AcrR family transcriptional regulator
MGRKDLTDERQTLILNATERCIARYGIHGATLEKIADEAGLNRGLIHHYIGNREDILQRMVERLLKNYQTSFDEFASRRPADKQASTLIDYYFGAWFELEPRDDAIITALLAESERDPLIRQTLWSVYSRFDDAIHSELASLYPHANPNNLRSTSYSIMLLAFSHATMNWLGLPRASQADVRSIAISLLQALEAR